MVIAYDLLEYRYIDDVTGNLLSLFCSTRRAVLEMFVRLFRFKVSESLKIVYQELFTKKNGETKRALDYLRMPKLQDIFTTDAIVCHRHERLAVLQNVFAIIIFALSKKRH